MDYEIAKRLMMSEKPSDRLKAAASPDTPPEILYYMAGDPDQDVRLAVANNPASPIHAAQLLAKDAHLEVRQANAAKIARLLPHLDEGAQSLLHQLTVDTIEIIVEDQITAVRAALSAALAEYAGTPPHVARKLAADVERLVAEPILRFCAALSDADLLEIIMRNPVTWRLVAIAGRANISNTISGALVNIDDADTTMTLLGNETAQIAVETFQTIMRQAENVQALRAALSLRKNLPETVADKIENFVERSVLNVLEKSEELDAATLVEVHESVSRRVKRVNEAKKGESQFEFAKRLLKEGKLNDTEIGDALAVDDHDFVTAAIAVLAKVPQPIVQKIFEAHSAKGIMAIAWRANLSPRFGLQLQRSKLGQIAPRQLLYPKDAGDSFPQTEAEMQWQLEFFGVEK